MATWTKGNALEGEAAARAIETVVAQVVDMRFLSNRPKAVLTDVQIAGEYPFP